MVVRRLRGSDAIVMVRFSWLPQSVEVPVCCDNHNQRIVALGSCKPFRFSGNAIPAVLSHQEVDSYLTEQTLPCSRCPMARRRNALCWIRRIATPRYYIQRIFLVFNFVKKNPFKVGRQPCALGYSLVLLLVAVPRCCSVGIGSD